MEPIRTGVPAQESTSHPRPAAATVADLMRTPADPVGYSTRRVEDRGSLRGLTDP
jgi:hypothetical protein